MGGKSGAKTFFYQYRMSVWWGWCLGPVDYVGRIFAGEKFAFRGTSIDGEALDVNLPDFWGGDEKEGGLQGRVHYFLGNYGGSLPNALAAKMGRTSATTAGPAGIAGTFFTNAPGGAPNNIWSLPGFFWTTNQPFIRPMWAEVQRLPKVLDPDLAGIVRKDSPVQTSQVLDISSEPGGGGAAHDASDAISQDIGVLLTGFSPYQVLRLSLPVDQTWVAWSPWGLPNWTGDNDSGSENWFHVIRDEDPGDELSFETPGPNGTNTTWDGYEAARAGFAGASLRGASRYRFYIKDNPISDNTGGLSVRVEVLGGVDANPAHMIYESMTDEIFGMNLPTAMFDTDAFNAAAQTFYDEGLGLSMKWMRGGPIEKIVQEMLDHVDALIFTDPESGLITIKPIRGDYDVGTLRELTDDNFETKVFQRKGLGETINEVVVTYTDPDTEKDVTVSMQDLGNISAQGAVVSDGRNYYGVRSADLATQLAARDLRVASAPLAVVEGQALRAFWNARPGEVLKYSSARRGITDMLLRVMTVDPGKPGSPTVKLTMTEDVFALPAQSFDAPQTPQFEDPSEAPRAMDYVTIVTLPYYNTVNSVTNPGLGNVEYPDVFAGFLAAQEGQDTQQYELLAEEPDPLGGTQDVPLGRRSTVQRSRLAATMAAAATSSGVVLENATQGPSPLVNGMLFIGDGTEASTEIAIVTGVVTDPLEIEPDQLTLQRGALDTVPRDWPAGTIVHTLNATTPYIDQTIRAALTSQNYKLSSVTSLGILAPSLTPIDAKTFTERPWLPTRPADVKVNGQGFDTVDLELVDPIPVTWARRNREMEDSVILPWTAADLTPEAGQTTTVSAYGADGTLLGSFPGQAGTSYNLDPVIFGAETMGFIGVSADNGGLPSLQEFRLPVVIKGGWDNNWGAAWDG